MASLHNAYRHMSLGVLTHRGQGDQETAKNEEGEKEMKIMNRVENFLDKINPWYVAAFATVSPIIGAMAANWQSIRWDRLLLLFAFLGVGILINRISCCPIRKEIRPMSYVIMAYGWPFYLLIVIPIMTDMDYKRIRKQTKRPISVLKVLILEMVSNTHWCEVLAERWGIPDDDITGG